mmetsp:Transcript_20219/g.49592  ORF Transcript_20219/g.49592 Transcript_20219/m.49592 type:complete len:161 (+) Transcript_20219:333-815(+)
MNSILIKNVAYIKKILESHKELINEVAFEFKQEFLNIQSIDLSHISITQLRISKSCFDNYENFVYKKFNISFQGLVKALKYASETDLILFKLKENDTVFSVVIETQDSRIADYELRIFNNNKPNILVPSKEYNSHLTISSNELLKLCKELANMSDIGKNS